jgi:glucose/mannose transport system substrate-binding protein
VHQQVFGKLVVVSLAAALGAGCGGGTPTKPTSQNVEIFSWWTKAGEAGALQEFIDIYKTTYPGGKVVNSAVVGVGDDARAILQTRIAGNQPPDLFQTTNGTDLSFWIDFKATAGAAPVNTVQALDDIYASEGWNAVIPKALVDPVTSGGHIYELPVNIHRGNSLFINKQIFADNQLTPPTTWDEFFTVADALVAKGITPLALPNNYTTAWACDFVVMSLLVGLGGPQYYIDFYAGKKSGDDPTFVTAMQTLQKLLGYTSADRDMLEWDQAAERLHSGKAAMYIHGDWVKGYLDAQGWTPGVDYDQLPGPGNAGTYLWSSDGFAMPVGAPDQTSATNLLKVFASRQGQIAFNAKKGSIPARNDISASALDVVTAAKYADFQNAAVAYPLANVPGKWNDPFYVEVEKLLKDGDLDALLAWAKANYPTLLGS